MLHLRASYKTRSWPYRNILGMLGLRNIRS